MLSAVMTVSALSLPGLAAHAETVDSTGQAVETEDTNVKYGGIFGSLLSDEIDESIQDSVCVCVRVTFSLCILPLVGS